MEGYLKQQKLQFDYENLLLATRIEVQEHAFKVVSQDIHDNIGQTLSIGCMQLAMLRNEIDNPVLLATAEDILQTFKKSVKDLRLLSHTLNTEFIEHRDLNQCIGAELDRIETFSAINCSILISEDENELPGEHRLIIFRIIQEALQNILKHAEATEIKVALDYNPLELTILIEDNGIGFVVDESLPLATLGLLSMKQRAQMLNAQLHVDSSPGNGTRLFLRIPIKT